MAMILISDPSPSVAALFAHVLEGCGHEAVVHVPGCSVPDPDLFLLEPSSPDALTCAYAVRRRRPDVPIVCASIYDHIEESDGLEPSAYLVKPFALGELVDAIESALRS